MPKQVQTLDQKQSLTMTTTMHQSISILQMSNIELSEFAAHELDKNPFIEDANVSIEAKDKKAEIKERFDTLPSSAKSNSYSGTNQDFFANIASEITLKEHIIEQINLAFDDNRDKLIANYLLDHLQSNGYLNVDLEDVAENLMCKYQVVEGVLKTLQKFDPVGIFARNLRECLMIQIKEKHLTDPSLVALVDNIDLIAKGDLKKLTKICNVTIANLSDMIKQLKMLNPKPGNGFLVEQTSYKIPDVILTISKDNIAKIETNKHSIPHLRVNEEYYLKIKDSMTSKEEKEFTKAEIDSANIVVKSIEQRANTIIRVASAIVEEQMDFFTKGVMYLKPMTLSKIAQITGFNESTISRSTANKYISAPSGIYELKYFFSSSLSNTRSVGEDVSSTKAKEIIRQIILSEESDNILSDDEISDQLHKFNISIARRTVAKYREAIGIPTSSTRKRQRAL
jgi:RNA polymerase sigma-54 factor